MHGCLGAEEVVPACFCSPKSPLENTALTESAAEAGVGVRSLPAALLPLLSNRLAIRNPGSDLEFRNSGGIFGMAGRGKEAD